MIKLEINQRVGKKVEKKWVANIVKIVFKKVNVKNAEISVAFVGDSKIKKLNSFYRGKNKTTDVLSFIYEEKKSGGIKLFGEIIISFPQAARQARECGWSAKQEIKELLVHGLLHLCGFDHEKSEREARKMKKMEQVILEKI
jgi:probable rRNA maturation factor